MTPDQPLRLRGLPVIHDTIDNETIAINQRTGRYYSFDGPGAAVWLLLEAGTTPRFVGLRLTALYDVTEAAVTAPLDAFLEELLAEELIEQRDAAPQPPQATPATGERAPFRGLEVHQYSDMEVLLLADPIHEVDESGWPTPLPASGD